MIKTKKKKEKKGKQSVGCDGVFSFFEHCYKELFFYSSISAFLFLFFFLNLFFNYNRHTIRHWFQVCVIVVRHLHTLQSDRSHKSSTRPSSYVAITNLFTVFPMLLCCILLTIFPMK